MQYQHYQSELEIFRLRPSGNTTGSTSNSADRFCELMTFMSHVAPCYKEECRVCGSRSGCCRSSSGIFSFFLFECTAITRTNVRLNGKSSTTTTTTTTTTTYVTMVMIMMLIV